MSQNDFPQLPPFDNLKKIIDAERKSVIQINEYSGADEDFVRSSADAEIILVFLEKLQTKLWNFFKEFPSLSQFFEKDYINVQDFFKREYIIDLCFLDECLFPEKESFFFGQDGAINAKILDLHLKTFDDWMEEKKSKHEKTQTQLRENFSIDIKPSELDCQCVACIADYRTKLREHVLESCLELIKESKSKIEDQIEDSEIDVVSHIFYDMQKEIDRYFHRVRYRFRRSTLNRLESQIRGEVKANFTYPSELALIREKKIVPSLKSHLQKEDIKDDIIGEPEYKKFFGQLANNIWRNERYILREFQKLVRSVMVLKRKDISGKILQDYIGEFWVHSQARTIKRKIIYHMGPTNSGKTYHSIEALSKAKKGCYLAPLRLLAAELYDTLNSKGCTTSLLTGEEVIEKEGATHYSSTIEMARLTEYFDCCVIDEIQMITDRQRGWAWTRAFVNIFADEIHLCGDPSALELIEKIVELCGDELEIRNYERMTELKVENKAVTLGDLERSDALIVFSRRNALRYKRDLERLGFKVSIVYGRLSPEVRREQARKFDQEETDIMVSTDAIAMGMNLPIKRIVFSTLSKFINSQEHPISESEVKQIAGRAGRFKRFPTGYVTCLSKVENGLEQVRESLFMTLEQQEKCMVGPDLDIFSQVNNALEEHGLTRLRLSEFLRLFNTMIFQKPFFCVDLKEMIELAEMVEDADPDNNLTTSEVFGFSCAPVNQGLIDHVHYFTWILNNYVAGQPIPNEAIDNQSNDIDYLETSIKCVELYQWLSRHFNNKHFTFDEIGLLHNKSEAVEKLNTLLSNKIVPTCSSCGKKMAETAKFNICESCFKERRFNRGRPKFKAGGSGKKSKESGNRKRTDGPNRGYYKGKKTTTRRRKRKSTDSKK